MLWLSVFLTSGPAPLSAIHHHDEAKSFRALSVFPWLPSAINDEPLDEIHRDKFT